MNALRPELAATEMSAALVFERASATPRKARRTDGAAHAARVQEATALVAPLSLEASQRWFQTVVTHPVSVEDGAVEAGLGIEAVVRPGVAIAAHDAVGVYHHAYRARLVECLADDYPVLAHTLGEEAFEELAARYIVRHPSRSPNLNAYGRHMEAFCASHGDPEGTFWADVARLEWALVEMIHAEDAAPLAARELAKISPESWARARLVPSDTLRVLRFAHPVNAYYRAMRHEEHVPPPPAAPQALAVYRQGFTLWRMELTPAMADLLEDLARGETLGGALSAMEARLTDPEALEAAAKDVMEWFSSWVQGGFFRTVVLEDAS